MKKKGFTLIEILAVIIILGIVAIIAIPAVSSYITDSRNKTYKAHEATMEEAAKSLTVECIDGKENCTLPNKDNSSEIYLSELIEKGFSEKLQNPQGEGYCNEELSYVRVVNKGKGYEYHSCLYCGNYVTEDDNCAEINASDIGSAPVCGTVTGQSSEWTNKPRTISVACTDPDNDCRFNTFPKTYKTTTINDQIVISDLRGHINRCNVNVNVDTTPPTCNLVRTGGSQEQQTGWYSGNVQIAIQNQNDTNSGLLTYGIGTSKTPDYNRKSSISLQDVNGLITVFGYVKDNAGNEAVCTQTIRVGIEKPEFDVYYGYQLLPTKEKYSLTGASISTDETNITMNGANAKLTFNNMNKYDDVKRAVIFLNNYVSNGITYRLKYGSKTVSGQVNEGTNRIVFEMDKGTYDTYEFTLGNSAGTLNIKRIELEKEKGTTYNTYTSKNATVNLVPSYRTEKVKTVEFSYNGGTNYQSVYYKEFSSSSSGNGRTKNDIGMVSDTKAYSVNNFDNTAPTINDLVASTTEFTNGTITITAKTEDTLSGLVQYAWSNDANLTYSSTEWKDVASAPNKTQQTYTHTVDRNQTVYFYAKDEAGNVSKKSYVIAQIDLSAPTCTSTSSTTSWTNGSVTVTGNCSDTGVSGCVGNSSVTKSEEFSGNVNPGQVCDRAGNCTPCPDSEVHIDTTPPTCTTTKTTVNSTAGVSASFSCDNNAGGSTTNCKSDVSEVKSSTDYEISDSAGNKGKCTLSVSSKQQKQTKTCATGNTCESSAFGTHKCNCQSCQGSCKTAATCTSSCCGTHNCNAHDCSCSTCSSCSGGYYAYDCITVCLSTIHPGDMDACCTKKWVCNKYSSYSCNCSTCYDQCNNECTSESCCGCAEYNYYECNCSQCNNSGTSISVCGCKTWNSYGSWSDDTSCTYSGENEASDHSSKSQCRTLYY